MKPKPPPPDVAPPPRLKTRSVPGSRIATLTVFVFAAFVAVITTIAAFNGPRPRAAAQCPDLASVRNSQEDLNHARVELEAHTALLTQIRDALRKR